MCRRPKRIVILGAGLAGLCAAYELAQDGHIVTILEASERVGGRVLTLREPFSDGLYAEAGGTRIPNSHELTIRYIRHFDLLLDLFPSGKVQISYVKGKRVKTDINSLADWPFLLNTHERKLGLEGIRQRYIAPALRKIGNASDVDWRMESFRVYDQMTFTEFLRQQGASSGAISLLTLGFDNLLDEISALVVLRDIAMESHTQQWYTIRGGNDLLPKAFAARLVGNIHNHMPVRRIEQTNTGVRVTAGHANRQHTFDADYLICSVPISLLRNIEVVPGLSAAKQSAMRDLEYTSVARIYLQSSRRIWKDEGLSGFDLGNADLPVSKIWDVTCNQRGVRGILLSYVFGQQSRRITQMTEDERLSSNLEQMEKVFPGLSRYYERGASKCWDDDKWARGAFAFFKPGELTSLPRRLASPEGRFHFAGEHTSKWAGWMQGALESGNRVATEINSLS